MLPTPHGPADPPHDEGAAEPDVADGRTPDEGALLRVVEHLTDEDEAADDAAPTGASTDDTASADDAAPADGPAQAAPPEPEVGPIAAALSDTRHTIDDLNPAEHVFLAQQRALVAELCGDPTDAAAVGALFDRVRAQWAQAEDRPDPRSLADAFGVALGDLVTARVPGLAWAVCSDRFGTEIVLAQREPEVLVYPVAAVGQHWESAAEGWFVAHLEGVVRGVAPSLSASDA